VSGNTGQQAVVRPIGERVEWMADHMINGTIDFSKTSRKLMERIGYTEFYSIILKRLDDGKIPEGDNFFYKAALHVLTPRVLFPDKSSLDDNAITKELTGRKISANTSMSVGYTAQANVDFGVPGMFIPICLIGVMLAAIVRYFMTRTAPLHLRQACGTACIFVKFTYGGDIDKSLGFVVTGFLAIAVILKYGYPLVAGWLVHTKTGESQSAIVPNRVRA
jgi:hypothetical protein